MDSNIASSHKQFRKTHGETSGYFLDIFYKKASQDQINEINKLKSELNNYQIQENQEELNDKGLHSLIYNFYEALKI